MTLVRTQPFFFVLHWSFPHYEVYSEICAALDTPLYSVRFLHDDDDRDRRRGNPARALAWRRRSQGVKPPPSPTTGWCTSNHSWANQYPTPNVISSPAYLLVLSWLPKVPQPRPLCPRPWMGSPGTASLSTATHSSVVQYHRYRSDFGVYLSPFPYTLGEGGLAVGPNNPFLVDT